MKKEMISIIGEATVSIIAEVARDYVTKKEAKREEAQSQEKRKRE